MQSFHPPKRTLMGPGPSDVHPRVSASMAQPTIGHLDPAFQGLMEEIKLGLRNAFGTENALTYPVSAPGSAGMETCFANLVEPGDRVLIARNGVFGNRMEENVLRAGGDPILVDFEWGQTIDVAKVAEVMKAQTGPIKALAFVHAETSTGAWSDAEALAALAQQYGALTIMDCVTSLCGIPVELDRWGIDAAYSGSQKCLSAPPGLSPVSFSQKAADAISARKTRVNSWFLDVSLVMAYWSGDGARTYHHTAPVNAMYGLHEALVMFHEEGKDAVYKRHKTMHKALVAGFEAMGLEMLVAETERLPQLNTVKVPDGVDEAAVRKHLLTTYNLEIGAGLGPLAGKVWRVGLMGAAANITNIHLCLTAMEDALSQTQAKIERGAAIAAAQAELGL